MPRLTPIPGGRARDEHDGAHGPLPWRPPPEWRQFVEIMCALGHSHEAIVRELKLRNLPCGCVESLQRAFPDELAHGKERRLAGYGVKLHSIAMSDSPQALSAIKFLLATHGGPQWRIPKDQVDPGDERALDAAVIASARRIYIPERDPGPVEGEA